MENINMIYVRAELVIRFDKFKKHNVDLTITDNNYIAKLKSNMNNGSAHYFENIINNINEMIKDPKNNLWNDMYNLSDESVYALYKLYCVEKKE